MHCTALHSPAPMAGEKGTLDREKVGVQLVLDGWTTVWTDSQTRPTYVHVRGVAHRLITFRLAGEAGGRGSATTYSGLLACLLAFEG